MSDKKYFRYRHASGSVCQANGIDIPAIGLYTETRLPQLDSLVGFSLVCTEEESLPISADNSPPVTSAKTSDGQNILVPKDSSVLPEEPVVYDYSEIELRKLGMSELREIANLHAVSGRSADSIIEKLKEKKLVGP